MAAKGDLQWQMANQLTIRFALLISMQLDNSKAVLSAIFICQDRLFKSQGDFSVPFLGATLKHYLTKTRRNLWKVTGFGRA